MHPHSEKSSSFFYLITIIGLVLIWMGTNTIDKTNIKIAYAQSTLTPTPAIRFPLVADAPVPGFFDHKQTALGAAAQTVQFYDGRGNPNGTSGYTFTCTLPSSNQVTDWVGCVDAVSGEANCANANELWYDNHAGVDVEYFPDWHTGSTCDLNKFQNRTYRVPIFSATAGEVVTTVYDPIYQGRYYLILVDVDKDGQTSNDVIRVWYLHLRNGTQVFYDGLKIQEGDYVADGDMTGQAWTPHLHFEVDRKISTTWRDADPFGWSGSGSDPHLYPSPSLWSYRSYSPFTLQTCTGGCSVVSQ